jgi:transcriptional regulator with XRE-family HTH domain
MTSLGALLREARKAAGVSQSALARRAGTSQSLISRHERGLVEPTWQRFEELIATLGWRAEVRFYPLEDGAHDADGEAGGDSDAQVRFERTLAGEHEDGSMGQAPGDRERTEPEASAADAAGSDSARTRSPRGRVRRHRGSRGTGARRGAGA